MQILRALLAAGTDVTGAMEVTGTMAISAQPLTVWDRPNAKDSGATFPLTAEQLAARESVAKQISTLLVENLASIGGFLTPGNPKSDGTPSNSIMVACTLPMPALTFVNPDGDVETTRPYNLNINAVLPAPKDQKETGSIEQPKALTYAELRKSQLAAKAKRK